MWQKTVLVGWVGGDPKNRTTPSKVAVTTFDVATKMRRGTSTDKPWEETTWHHVVCLGTRLADAAARRIRVGSLVVVEGKLRLREWEDKTTGERRSRMELLASTFEVIMGPKLKYADEGQAEE